MDKEIFYVVSFNSTNHAIQTEKMLKEQFKIATIPTPREITQSCGLSIRFYEYELKKIMDFLAGLTVPCSLYKLSAEKKDGKREIQQIEF